MKKSLLFVLAICLGYLTASAQSVSVNLLKSAVDKVQRIKNLSFTVRSIGNNPFSVGDTTISEVNETIVLDGLGNLVAQNQLININNYQSQLREVYRNDTLYNIDLRNSIYSIDLHPKDVSNSLSYFVDRANYAIQKHPSKILSYADTTINNVSCYSLFINAYDTVENNNHNFTHQYLYLSKETLLPVLSKEIGAGMTEKDGHSLGRLSFYNLTNYSNYMFDREPAVGEFNFKSAGFEIRYEKMLADGTRSPDILVRSLYNKTIATSYFKHKILVLEFGSTICGANPLANPMMNRLSKKFNGRDVLILSIYSEETPEQVRKYIAANNLQFPIYLGDKILKRHFHTVGTPNFYIVDKDGMITKSMNGYNDQLELQITEEIDRLKKR
jgi:thiol-disulfide isomerase/thioredoxin